MERLSNGLILVHAVSRTLSRQVSWTIGHTLRHQVELDWIQQPLKADCVRSEFMWQATEGMGAVLTSALSGWRDIWFEVTELASEFESGSRWQYTPTLGIKHRATDAIGNVMIGEDEMRSAMQRASANSQLLLTEMKNLLAEPWDSELEPLRAVGDASRVVWLHAVS